MPTSIQANESLYYTDFVKRQQENATGNQEMGKDAFLKILLTQLQNQDPMNPMEDKEFISQMANFSSLEQMTNMNENIQKFIELQKQQEFVSHSDLIGKKIEWNKVISGDGEDKETTVMDGIVTSVIFKDGQAKLVVDGETKVATKDLISVMNNEDNEV